MLSVFKKFPRTFWVANSMELFERWAYYGLFTVLSVYLINPVSKGGLGFSNTERGLMQGIVNMVIYLLPVLTGAIADKFGFRKVLLSAFVCMISGYYFMGQFDTYALVFAMFLIAALGASLFKPIITATVSKTTTKENDTVGFGIFYMIVNIGGFIGPFVASKLRDLSWDYVFIMTAAVILINFILINFYKEPGREKQADKEPLTKTIAQIFKNMGIALSDVKFLVFVIIMVGFWTTYWQLFLTLPVYITQWVNTTDIYNSSSIIAKIFGAVENGTGIIRPEMMTNLAAFTIIIFQVAVSVMIRKTRPVFTMIVGTIIIAIGFGQMSFQTWGYFIILGIFIIACGEMISSPRIQEYISRIAPRDKVALYMGVSFLPVAGGNLLGGLFSGILYDKMSDKYIFLKEELVKRGYDTMENLQNMDGGILFKDAMNHLGMTEVELNNLLYSTYHPGNIWLIFAAIGIGTAVILFLYDKFLLKEKLAH